MYRLMRNTHLILGLVFVVALGVYLASSVRLAHRAWFSPRPTVTEVALPVDPGQAATPRALGMQLMQRHGLRGEIARVQPSKDGAFSLVIRRMGTNYQIQYREGAAEAQVKTTRLAFIGMLQSMHFSYGFWHEDGMINVWGGRIAVDLDRVVSDRRHGNLSLVQDLRGTYGWYSAACQRVGLCD